VFKKRRKKKEINCGQRGLRDELKKGGIGKKPDWVKIRARPIPRLLKGG